MFALNEGNKGRRYRTIAKGTTNPAIGYYQTLQFSQSHWLLEAYRLLLTAFDSFGSLYQLPALAVLKSFLKVSLTLASPHILGIINNQSQLHQTYYQSQYSDLRGSHDKSENKYLLSC